MRGPRISPASMRRRSGTEFAGLEPMSQTVVKPQRVSMSCMCFSSGAAGPPAALFHTGSVKWTWLFQKPATMALPAQSMTRASFGTCTSLRGPIAVMTPSDATTTASRIGAAVGEG